MSKKPSHPHSNLNELVKARIPALSKRAAENNKAILEKIALEGPLLKYDVSKSLNLPLSDYGTISRRIDALTKAGYLEEAGKRATRRGKQTKQSLYGLTWRGFIASLTIKEVRENILQVLKRNPLLALPEKEIVLLVLEELVTQQELETIARTVLEAFLRTIPNLELVENEPMSILAWLSSIKEIKFPDAFKLSKIQQDAWELLKLLDKPAILQAVKEKLVPLVKQKTMETKAMYQTFLFLNEVGEFISNLEVEDHPSKKIREYYENELKPKLERFSEEDQ
ncbi:MAG: hypothetical protein ACXACF_11965 [Candidatus Hermodarchaeia archaeon]